MYEKIEGCDNIKGRERGVLENEYLYAVISSDSQLSRDGTLLDTSFTFSENLTFILFTVFVIACMSERRGRGSLQRFR